MLARITIIGGGIGGLSAAIALTRAGFPCHVYERAPLLREVGAAISLWPNATRILQSWGVLAPLLEHAHVESHGLLRTRRGTVLKHVRTPTSDAPTLFCHRADLLDALRQAIPATLLSLNKPCTGYELTPAGPVAIFSDGSRSTPADLLIGADGLRSTVRAQLLHDGPPVYRGHTIWRGVAPFHSPDAVGETWGRGQRFGFIPLGQGRTGWWATANAPEGFVPTAGHHKSHVQRLFANWHPPIPALLEATPADAYIQTDLYDRPPSELWGTGPLTLLGDAAHPTTPNLGQGACMAIEDAAVLARCLIESPTSPQTAARQYEQLRQPRTARVTYDSLKLGRIGQWSNPLACLTRDLAMRLMPESFLARQMASLWQYRVGD
jgi:2-polyprenyl-6-methoxyphenol hydroxylase-like FAD-dependent oxidoreductase